MLFKKKKKPAPAPGRRQTRRRAVSAPNANVFSYYAGNRPTATEVDQANNVESRAASRTKISRLRMTVRVVVVIGVMAALLTSISLGNQPRVVILQDDTDAAANLALRSETTYEQAARQLLQASPLNKTKLTIDIGGLTNQLERQFPELSSVSVRLPFFGRQPVIYVQPLPAQLILTPEGGHSFAIDPTGRAMASGGVVADLQKAGLPTVTDQSGLPVRLGQAVMPRSDVSFITEVVRQLRAQHLTVSQLILPKESSELYVKLEGVGYIIKFNLRGDARVEAGAFLATKKRLDDEHKTPAEYVDVRVENRTYVK